MTRAELKALILSLFEDNITELISPKDGRDSFDALIDNLLNLEDDYDLLGLKVHTTGRVYNVGDTYYYGQGIYGVTASHTGGAAPDFTKATLIASVNTSAILDYTSGMTVTDGQVCNFHGTLIRVNAGTGTVTSTDPITDGFWTFLNFKDEDSATVSGAYTYNGQNLNAKNVNIGITGNMTITFARIQKYGIYKITFSNSFAPKTVTFTDLCTNMYTGATITSITIPTGDCVIYIAKAYSGYYHIGGRVMDLSALISNAAYDSSWLGNSTQGASKNAIYEKIESVIADYNSRIDAAIEGVKWKTPVQVLPTENIDLGLDWYNIDGIDIYEGDRVALALQSNPTENGLYVLGSDNLLTRSADADTGDELAIAQFIVLQGSHANETWGVNNRFISLGATPISLAIRNNNTTPDATESVSGKGKIASDSQVDALLTGSTTLPLQSNTWLSLRGLKRALNWVVGLFYSKGEIDEKFQLGNSLSATAAGSVNDYTVVLDDGSTTFGGVLPRAFYLKFPTGLLPTGVANINTGAGITNIWRQNGTALQPGDIIADTRYLVTLKGSAYVIMAVGITASGGGGAVSSVNTKTGAVTLNQDEIPDGATYKQYSQTEKTKLGAISGTNTGDETNSTILAKIGYTPENVANKGASNGYAPLVSGLVPSSYLPSFVDDVIEGYLLTGVFYSDSGHTTALTGEVGKIYVDLTAGQSSKQYRWSGTVYIQITNGLIASTDNVPEGATNLYFTGARAIASLLTGFSSVAGTVVATDSILTAINKIVGNIALLASKDSPVFTTKTTHTYATANKLAVFNASKELVASSYSESELIAQQITITTSTSITTSTLDASSIGQNGKTVIIDNSTNAINFTLNGGITASYLKHGTGTITVLRGSGREMYVNGSNVASALFNGLVGSTMSIIQVGTRDYVNINNI